MHTPDPDIQKLINRVFELTESTKSTLLDKVGSAARPLLTPRCKSDVVRYLIGREYPKLYKQPCPYCEGTQHANS